MVIVVVAFLVLNVRLALARLEGLRRRLLVLEFLSLALVASASLNAEIGFLEGAESLYTRFMLSECLVCRG